MKRIVYGVIRRSLTKGQEIWLWTKYDVLRGAFRIESHLTYAERAQLYELSRGAKVVCEIGSYVGASASCFGAAMRQQGFGTVLCIDTWKNDAMTAGNRDTWVEFRHNTRQFRGFIQEIRGYSTEVVECVREITERIDLLFIDGDHSWEGVKADWESYRPLLRAGSIVVFHDYGWAEGVRNIVEQDVIHCVSEYDSLPNLWWGIFSALPRDRDLA